MDYGTCPRCGGTLISDPCVGDFHCDTCSYPDDIDAKIDRDELLHDLESNLESYKLTGNGKTRIARLLIRAIAYIKKD